MITARVWQWESRLRKHDEHQYEYTIPDGVKRLTETLTQTADAIVAQIPVGPTARDSQTLVAPSRRGLASALPARNMCSPAASGAMPLALD